MCWSYYAILKNGWAMAVLVVVALLMAVVFFLFFGLGDTEYEYTGFYFKFWN